MNTDIKTEKAFDSNDLRTRVNAFIKKSNLSVTTLANLFSLEAHKLSLFLKGEAKYTDKSLEKIAYHLPYLEKMLKRNFFPIPKKYSSQLRGLLALKLIEYFEDKVNNRKVINPEKANLTSDAKVAFKYHI